MCFSTKLWYCYLLPLSLTFFALNKRYPVSNEKYSLSLYLLLLLLCFSQVECLHVAPEAMEMTSQQDLERKMAGLRNEVQVQIMLLYAIVLCFVI